ncbi:asparagine synthase (glutamine-hydrolyzing) [Planctomycetota bacterium]|nr:asparagine synthase (glutamine-hydrolyzing) [Planctomycetota bacterium]
MCGFLTFSSDHYHSDFERALDTLASRGPDDRGIWAGSLSHGDADVQLGHRRLSVVDLEHGRQPMITSDDRYVIVYNGEIYNAPELRKQLVKQGVQFQTHHSDTEVLLLGFAHWGLDSLLPKLDGMFAFTIYDRKTHTFHAAKDRFGIKPFYYSTHQGFITASTLAPFWQLANFPRKLNYHALREYLACQSIPSPLTILRDVHSLPPGHSLTYHKPSATLKTKPFWSIPQLDTGRDPSPFEDLVEQTDAALKESVKRQMVSDVPLGAFLSGGIDSSLMTYYMAQASGSSRVQTFTIGFPFGKGYDETKYAQKVAEQLGCKHHLLSANEIDATFFESAIKDLDQPFADPAYLPLSILCQLTKQHVTVAIAGDGGDELFCGYNRFLETETKYPPTLKTNILSALDSMHILHPSLRRRALSGKQKLLWDRVKLGPFPGTRKDMASLLAKSSIKQADISRTLNDWLSLAASFSDPIDIEALTRADLHTYLSENCLAKSDRASMAHSLEVRVPFLGNPVTDLILTQPASSKYHNQTFKAILTELSRRHLPREVWDRPKHGFSVPVSDFIFKQWSGQTNQWLDQAADIAPFLNTKEINRRYRKLQQRREDSRTVYTILTLLGWLTTHPIDSDTNLSASIPPQAPSHTHQSSEQPSKPLVPASP